MEQILLAYGLPKETIAETMMLYKNPKVKACSSDGDTDFLNIVAGVLQADGLAPWLFIICLDYVLQTSMDLMKEKGFTVAKARSRRYPARMITDADYADDIVLMANMPDQAESLLHSPEWAVCSIGLDVNEDKTKFMCFNQRGDISILNGRSLKLVDKFTYLESSISSTEKDMNTQLMKEWRAIDILSVIWKSDQSDKIKRSFFQAMVMSVLLYGSTT